MNNQKLLFKKILEEDFPSLTPVMKCAFDGDTQKHLELDEGGPPGNDNGNFFRTWLLPYQESVGYKIMTGVRIIGGIIVWILPLDSASHLFRLYYELSCRMSGRFEPDSDICSDHFFQFDDR